MQIGDKIDIGPNVTIKYMSQRKGGKILISFEAPKEIQILRQNAKYKTKKGKQ